MIHALFAAALMHYLVVSDVHLDPYDARTRIVYAHDANRTLLRSAVRAMRADVPNARVVILGGDLLAHHFDGLARAAHQDPYAAGLAATREVTDALARAFPKAQFLVTLGNNDDPCGDYRAETGGPYLRALAALYAPLVDRGGAAPGFARAFERGGYYTARLPNGTRAIVLNTVFDSIVFRGGCRSHAHGAAHAQAAWLARELARSRNAVLLMHIPPGYDPGSTTLARDLVAVPFLRAGSNASLLAALRAERAHVRFAVAGHVHRYDLRIAGGVPLLIASSISPVYRNNPAFFDLLVAPDGSLRDVVPYVYDPRSERWHAEPSFDRTYGVDGFTAANLRRAHAEIERDPDVRARWIAAYDVWSARMGDISDHRSRVFWCAQTELGSGYGACAGTRRRSRIALIAAAIAGMAIVATIVLLVRRRRARLDRV